MWPTSGALKELTATEEASIGELVKIGELRRARRHRPPPTQALVSGVEPALTADTDERLLPLGL
jgi:hypothetical protein